MKLSLLFTGQEETLALKGLKFLVQLSPSDSREHFNGHHIIILCVSKYPIKKTSFI